MSGKGPSGRGKRPEKDSHGSESKNDGNKGKHDSKLSDSRDRAQILSDGRSPSHGRPDRNHNTKEKPYYKAKDRSGGEGKKRDGDKTDGRKPGRLDFSGHKHGRDSDGLSSHGHGHGRDGDRGSSGRDAGLGPGDGTGSKKQSEGKLFVDDSRLSKLVRRVTREDDRDRRLTATKQLRDFLMSPENAKAVTKVSDSLLVVLQDIFYEKTYKEVKQDVARCIGVIGTVPGADAHRYFQWLFAKLTAAHSDEAKILLLFALLQTLKQDDEKQKLVEFMSMIMSNCQSILENADLPELLIAVIDIILHIVRIQPESFNNHFRDTVDILVGWHIDSTQKESLTRYTSEALISFHQFWVADLTFSITLLGQFLEDMEAYAEDLSLGLSGNTPLDSDMPPPEECVSKIANLLRVFTTVMKSLGEYFTPAQGPPVTTQYLVDTVERVIRCVENSNKSMYSERVATAANQCVEVLVNNLRAESLQAIPTIQTFLMDQQQLQRRCSNHYFTTLLSVTHKVIEQVGTQLPVSFIQELLSSGSLTLRLRFAQSVEVINQLMAVYTAVMALKSVPLLEEAYRHVLGDLEIAYSALLESCEADMECRLVTANPYPDVSYTNKQAEVAIMFDICALAEVGNTKNNLIGMWALSPSIFELLTTHLIPAQSQLKGRHPSTQHALLQTLHSHSARHGHFISSSVLITQNTVLEGTVLANVSPATAHHFTTVLTLLADRLNDPTTPGDTSNLCMRWVMEISEGLVNSQHIFLCPEFLHVLHVLVQLGYTQESSVALAVCACLQTVLAKMMHCPTTTLQNCVDLCLFRITDSVIKVRHAFMGLLRAMPINITTRACMYLVSKLRYDKSTTGTVRNMSALWAARRGHQSLKTPLGTFHSHNFRTVMAYILHNIPTSKLSGYCWLERMFYTSHRLDKDADRREDFIPLTQVVDQNDGQLWFWAVWESAQFCVLSKLRTPLGKPHDTFTTIESAIKRYAAEVRNKDTEDNTRHTEDNSDVGVPSFVAELRVSLLLQFMEHLEKLLHNAYEGCAVAMVAPPKTVRTFFRNNRGTCQEWLTRVRLPLALVSLNSNEPALAVRQTSEHLRELHDSGAMNGPELDHVVMYMVQALVELRCPESILGLYFWIKEVTGRRLTWIKAMAELAHGRYEVGAVDLKSALRQHITPETGLDEVRGEKDRSQSPSGNGSPCHSPKQSFIADGIQKLSILSKQSSRPDVLAASPADPTTPDPVIGSFMVDQVCSSYMSLGAWEEVLDWQETIQQYRAEHSGSPLQKAFYTHADVNYIKALSRFEEHDFEGVREALELVPGASLADFSADLPLVSGDGVWSKQAAVELAQKQLVRVATYIQTEENWRDEMSSILRCVEGAQRMCEGVLRVSANEWPPAVSTMAVTHLYTAATLKDILNDTGGKTKGTVLSWCDDLGLIGHEHDVATMQSVLSTLRLRQNMAETLGMDDNSDTASRLSLLQLSTAHLARKTHNFVLAEKLLVEEAVTCSGAEPENGHVDSVLGALSSLRAANGTVAQVKLLRMEREGAKLLHTRGQQREAIDMLTASVLSQLHMLNSSDCNHSKDVRNETSELVARSVVGLVQWLQLDHKNLSALTSQLKLLGQGDDSSATRTSRNLKSLVDMERSARKLGSEDQEGSDLEDSLLVSENDVLVGRLLSLATAQCPTLAKAWFALAGWCYKWGRKAVDSASNGSVDLSIEEKAQALNLLPKGTSNEETESVLNILSQVHANVGNDEDISDQDQSLYDDGAEITRRQLLSSCLTLQIASDETIDRLLEVWRRVVQRVYHYYQMAAQAYFTFLKLNAQAGDELGNMDGNITSTLRLLRLLVKHAWELREVLEDRLAHTPTTPWKGIIPQLFSRLNHPEAYVRQSVSELLCRVAQDAPHLIVYPAVVGCNNRQDVKDSRDGLLSKYLEQPPDAETEEGSQVEDEDDPGTPEEEAITPDDPNTAMLQNCFRSIVDTLAHHNPRMISEVELLVSELRRITLLWDELWLGTLNQQHHDVMRRLVQLDTEVRKVNTNASLTKEEKAALIREKHVTIMKPTVYTMERLVALTSAPAETPHEQNFQEMYGNTIREALEKLKNPTNPSSPHASWAPFKLLHRSLQDRAQKRASLVLTMDQVSHKLGTLSHTVIAMPGITTSGQVVTIESIHAAVHILPTKTKPKKLVFIGSDGKSFNPLLACYELTSGGCDSPVYAADNFGCLLKEQQLIITLSLGYPYLFKGLEDLHLDERIMQFLSIVNNMFAKTNRGDRKLYQARHYSVTPLGARSGLIQWVDGATPLFSLYKRWQQREAIAQQLKIQQQPGPSQNSTTTPSAPSIPRPSDVFYNKLTPALKEKGLVNLENRKEWPTSVMRQVLQELMNETPRDLLAKELWCSSTSASEWWRVTQTYARSTAVMSMIGYIIGLGDRHLDNVLVDLITGEVVHIDYNVCFEKGKGLRVPEKVPFRMTPNIEAALGVTGVEGMFRISCEHVIKTMRKGRETLLTLLEAFVYDPLVDWTTSNEGGYTGAFYGGGQTVVSVADGHQTKKDMERDITQSMFSIRIAEMKASWLTNREDMLSCVPRLQEAVVAHFKVQLEQVEARAALEQLNEQLTYVDTALNDANHPAYSLQHRYDEFVVVRATRQEAESGIQEKLNECDQWHSTHKYALSVVQGPRLQKLCSDVTASLNTSLPGFGSVVDFLQGAGQSHLVSQCESTEGELQMVLHQRRGVLHSCLDVLHTYATIVSQFPSSYVTENRTSRWQHWLQMLICDFTLQRCKDIVSDFQDHYGLTASLHPATPNVLATETKMTAMVSEGNVRLLKVMERRAVDSSDTSQLALHVQETTSSVHLYLHEHGLAGIMCMTSVIVSALCSLSKRYLVMEGAAAAAADRLMDLTSRDGDWFLDELASMSGNVGHLLHLVTDISMLPLMSEDICQRLSAAMTSVHVVYVSLQDLYVNFRSIIVPEAAKTLSRGDTSVIASVTALQRLVDEAHQPLEALMSQLETQLRNAAIGSEVDQEPVSTVKRLRHLFNELLQGEAINDEAINLTSGQMLLMGFNGLFTRLDADFSAMLDATAALDLPDTWRKVDVLREARGLQSVSLTEQNLSLLSHLFFVKQLRAMIDFFHMCNTSVATLNSVTGGALYDDEQLSRPIKHFIAEYVRKHLIGLPSQTLGHILCVFVNALHVDVTAEIELHDVGAQSKVSMEALCKKAVDTNLKNGAFEHRHLTHASTLLGAVDMAWRKSDLARRLDGNITLLKGSVQRSQMALSRFYWLHEDIFTKAGHVPNAVYMPTRSSIMAELSKNVQTLISHESVVMGIQEQHHGLEGSITQRLKWAAGANPSLLQVLQQFEEALTTRSILIQNENSLATEVTSICNSILHFEALRTRSPEAITADTSFLQLINRCEESCMLLESCSTSVTEVEEALYMIKPLGPGEIVTSHWLTTVRQHVTMATADLQTKIEHLGSSAETSKEGVKQRVSAIRSVLSTHHKLMSDIRSILKSMAKQEEYDFGPEPVPGGIHEYVNKYKCFSESFTTMLKLVMSEDLSPESSHEINTMMKTLSNQIVQIYDDLVGFAPPLTVRTTDEDQAQDQANFATALKKQFEAFPPMSPKKLPLAQKTGERLGTPPAGTASPTSSGTRLGTPTIKRTDKVARDPRTGKAVQERNSYAVGVWRRVKLKLDGRDPDLNKRFSVAEQVDFVIREATNMDNLAVLYEGWTPWV